MRRCDRRILSQQPINRPADLYSAGRFILGAANGQPSLAGSIVHRIERNGQHAWNSFAASGLRERITQANGTQDIGIVSGEPRTLFEFGRADLFAVGLQAHLIFCDITSARRIDRNVEQDVRADAGTHSVGPGGQCGAGEASAEVALITSSGARALRIRVNLGCKTSEFAFTRLLSNAAFGLFGFPSLTLRRSLLSGFLCLAFGFFAL